jgi:hypothetical protein
MCFIIKKIFITGERLYQNLHLQVEGYDDDHTIRVSGGDNYDNNDALRNRSKKTKPRPIS